MSLLSFNDDDVRLLRGLIHRERRRNRNRGTGPTPENLPPTSDERYIVKLPEEGISALDPTGDDPVAGKADCNVYIAVADGSGNYELADTGYAIRVLNLGGPVGHAAWGVAGRDKYGVWVLEKVWSYQFCKAILKGELDNADSTGTVDAVVSLGGATPVTSDTDELTVGNAMGYEGVDDVECRIRYDHEAEQWEFCDMARVSEEVLTNFQVNTDDLKLQKKTRTAVVHTKDDESAWTDIHTGTDCP